MGESTCRARRAALVGSITMALAWGCGGPEPIAPAEDGGTVFCAAAADCDDGLFCNGAEVCMPGADGADARGCLAQEPPCMESQRCSETEDRCVTSCAVAPDADGDGADALACGGSDCDDADPRRAPSLLEICDPAGRDEDCDPTTFGSLDADGDGFVDAACCNADEAGTMRCGDDCNDRRRDSHPGASEMCDSLDNDCDGSIDEALRVMQWPDADRDLHGDEAASGSMECPGAPGFSTVHDDCDDTSAIRHRAQLEICDRVDNDCDGLTDEAPVSVPWYLDADGDGFGAPGDAAGAGVVVSCEPVPGYSTRPSDCDDAARMINPAAREVCNGVDDDCNGLADAPGLAGGDTEDDDGDGHADMVCGGDDCDDARADVFPRAQELCNGVDDDCNGAIDGASADARWYLDRDGDGYGDEAEPFIESCEPQALRVPRGGDCDDSDASVHPRAPDTCDDVDTDCDGTIDENGIRFAFFPDADGDGWGTTDRTSVVFRCTAPAGTSDRTGDCADTDPMRHPTAAERCDSLDDDCDGTVDEATAETWYADVDGDGYGAGPAVATCLPAGTASTTNDDCDDTDPTRAPGELERCNGRDDDCDGTVDGAAADAACTFPNAIGTCQIGGVCALACTGSFGDCDGLVTTGCEVDVGYSSGHCGACGDACNVGDTCGAAAPGTCDLSPVVALDGEDDVVVALRANGQMVSWGSAAFLRSAQGGDQPAPAVTSLRTAAELAIGAELACARTTGGRVACWGSGTYGGFGNGTSGGGTTRVAPGEVPDLAGVVDIGVGQHHACAVLSTGRVMCWGYNISGQLGVGDTTQRTVPTEVPGITDAVEVAAMNATTCARRGTPGAYYVTCWGYGTNGQRGIGTNASSTSPAENVTSLPGNVARFSHGYSDAMCAITTDGIAYCWGLNGSSHYGLGIGPTSPISVFTPITLSVGGVLEVSLDRNGGCLRRRDVATTGEVYCWGYNNGTGWIDGYTGNVYTPVRVGGTLSDAVAIVAGDQRWCAARADGRVVCQGVDNGGALGDGLPLATSTTPVTALGLP